MVLASLPFLCVQNRNSPVPMPGCRTCSAAVAFLHLSSTKATNRIGSAHLSRWPPPTYIDKISTGHGRSCHRSCSSESQNAAMPLKTVLVRAKLEKSYVFPGWDSPYCGSRSWLLSTCKFARFAQVDNVLAKLRNLISQESKVLGLEWSVFCSRG